MASHQERIALAARDRLRAAVVAAGAMSHADRMLLIASYGLLLKEDDLFGKERSQKITDHGKFKFGPPTGRRRLDVRDEHVETVIGADKERVDNELKRRRVGCAPEYSEAFRLKVVAAANRAVKNTKPGTKIRGEVWENLGNRFKINPNTVRKWHKQQGLH